MFGLANGNFLYAYMNHTIICRSNDEHLVVRAYYKAISLFESEATGFGRGSLVSLVTRTNVNGECSFFIAPHGNESGTDQSKVMDRLRQEYIEWLRSTDEIEWVVVLFGSPLHPAKIEAYSDDEFHNS